MNLMKDKFVNLSSISKMIFFHKVITYDRTMSSTTVTDMNMMNTTTVKLVYVPPKRDVEILPAFNKDVGVESKTRKVKTKDEKLHLDLFTTKEFRDTSYSAQRRIKLRNTQLCKRIYTTRKCNEDCSFAHSVQELVKKGCKYPRCRYANSTCRFWHDGIDTLESWCERNGYSEIKDLNCQIFKKKVKKVIQKPASRINTKLCRSVEEGKKSCQKGCLYAHSLDDLVLLSCVWDDGCTKRNTCTFKHSNETRNEYMIRLGLQKYGGIVVEKVLTARKVIVKTKTKVESVPSTKAFTPSTKTWATITPVKNVSLLETMDEESAAKAIMELGK